MRPSVLAQAVAVLPDFVRRLGLPGDFGAMGGALQGAGGYGPTVMGPYEDPFPAWSPTPDDVSISDTGGFPQLPARIDPRAALLKARSDAFGGLRSAVNQPPVRQPVPKMGIQDPKKAGIIAAIALLSQLFNKGGEFGTGLVGGFMQGQEQMNQQDYAQQVADANAQAQAQKVKQALAEMMLQEANLGLSEYDRQEQIGYGRREDARKEFLGEQARREQLKLQQDQIDYAKLKQLEQDKRMEQDDLRAEASNFNTRYANARSTTANWDEAAASVWAKQREQLKLRGIPGEWLSPVAPAGSQTNAIAGREQRAEQFDWTKSIRQEYLQIAKDRANRADEQVPKDVAQKRAAIAKADERILEARDARVGLLEMGPLEGQDIHEYNAELRAAVVAEALAVNRKKRLLGLPEVRPEVYAEEVLPFLKALKKAVPLMDPAGGNRPVTLGNPGMPDPAGKAAPVYSKPQAGAGFEQGWRDTQAKIKAAYTRRDRAAAEKALAEFKKVYGVAWKPNERFR